MDQIGIAFTGPVAIFLTQSKHAWLRRYACLFGISAQPFWFWSSYHAQQWGVLVLSFFYAAAWGKGVWQNWLRPTQRD